MSRHIKVLNRQFYPTGSTIMKEGEYGDKAYFIENGMVEVFKCDNDGNEIVLAHVGVNSIIGEMSVIRREIRTASIRALQDCVLIPISSDDFDRAMNKADKSFRALMEILIDRLGRANQKMSQQIMDMDGFEESAMIAMENMARMLPEEERYQFQNEFKPIINSLRHTVSKYQPAKVGDKRKPSPDKQAARELIG